MGLGQLHESQGGHWADAKPFLEVLKGCIHEWVDACGDRIVDEDIEAAKRRYRIRYQGIERIEIRDVAFDRHSLAVKAGLNVSNRFLTLTQRSSHGHNRNTALCQRKGNALANALARAGDQRNFAVKGRKGGRKRVRVSRVGVRHKESRE